MLRKQVENMPRLEREAARIPVLTREINNLRRDISDDRKSIGILQFKVTDTEGRLERSERTLRNVEDHVKVLESDAVELKGEVASLRVLAAVRGGLLVEVEPVSAEFEVL